MSLGALFLLDAAKKTDNGILCFTIWRKAHSDVTKRTDHLQEKGVTIILENRSSPAFTNPDDAGLYKLLTSTSLHKALFRTCIDDIEDLSSEATDEENEQSVDIHYEIADIF